MRSDIEQIKNDFNSIKPDITKIALDIENHLSEIFSDVKHIDRITSRIKGDSSFINKASKEKDGDLKYQQPLKEIQDLIGARIVVYYKCDVEPVADIIKKYFQTVEQTQIIPDDVKKFGYEGLHFICFIPNTIYSNQKINNLIPNFFELQIKTLYQHAWSQAEHGLGYKPNELLTYDEERKLAFIAAQSWGADAILMELLNNKK